MQECRTSFPLDTGPLVRFNFGTINERQLHHCGFPLHPDGRNTENRDLFQPLDSAHDQQICKAQRDAVYSVSKRGLYGCHVRIS